MEWILCGNNIFREMTQTMILERDIGTRARRSCKLEHGKHLGGLRYRVDSTSAIKKPQSAGGYFVQQVSRVSWRLWLECGYL